MYRLIKILPLVSLFFASHVFGQVKKVDLEFEATGVSSDSYGNMFITDAKGNVTKYSSKGDMLLNYSPQTPGEITLIEAWNTIQIFLFYREYQQIDILDRFMAEQPSINLEHEDIGFCQMATLASDYNIWIFDNTDFSLKKFDKFKKQILFTTPLSLVLPDSEQEIVFIKEYQNRVYIAEEGGKVLVFDLFGNYLKTIELAGASAYCFSQNELYFVSEGKIKSFHLYDLEISEKVDLKAFGVENLVSINVTMDNCFLLFKNKLLLLNKKL